MRTTIHCGLCYDRVAVRDTGSPEPGLHTLPLWKDGYRDEWVVCPDCYAAVHGPDDEP